MDNNNNKSRMPLTSKSIAMLAIGLVLMLLGYVLMTGGGVSDPQVFNYDMFDFRRIVLSPIVIVAGIVLIIVAIMRRPSPKEEK